MNLYRRSIFQASLLLLLAFLIAMATMQAQRRKPHKLRAIAVAQVTIDNHGVMLARLYPITVLDDGSFHDAGIYKNDPQPMALDQGVVYEVQKTGQTVGYLTVGKATKEKQDVWSALGKWEAASPAAPKAQASPALAPVNADDERPILHRPGSQAKATPTPTPTPAASASPSASPAASPTPAVAAASPAPQAPAATEPEDPNRPRLRHRTAPSAAETSGTVELQPVASARPGAPPPATFSLTPGTQSLVAISDEQSSDTRTYQFAWKPGEEAPIDAKVRRLALAQLVTPGLKERSLANVVIRSFDLDLSNDAVMVLSAEIPPAPPASAKAASKTAPAAKTTAAAKTAPSGSVTHYITLIARVDFEGEPQKLAFSVTDSSRLDVAPRLELVDAVDVDGDGIAELLFRQYGFDDTSYVIYQIGRSTVTKLFEGASQPLK